MRGLTEAFADRVCAKLETLDPETKPAWGTLSADEIAPHLIASIKSSMGQLPANGFQGNWFTTTILPKIVFTGIMLPPKHIKTLDAEGNQTPAITAPGDASTLRDTMHEYMRGERAGVLTCNRHPLFGDIGPAGWSKVHVLHCKHHLKQFGLL